MFNCFFYRLLTYSYLSQFAARLMLFPSNLSYDWQMGSIPLITSLIDLRNSLTLIFLLILLALFWRFFFNLQNELTNVQLTPSLADKVSFKLTLPFYFQLQMNGKLERHYSLTETDHFNLISFQIQNERLFLGLCFLIIPFIPASNLFVTVGFVVAERVLYIPRYHIIFFFSSNTEY